MKKYRSYLIIALVIGALVFVKLQFFSPKKPKSGKEGGNNKAPVTPVSVYVTSNKQLKDKLYASGTLVANEEANLTVEASGRVVQLNLPEGRAVKAGTLLLKVNDAELRAQLNKLKTQLKLAADASSRQKKLLEIEGTSQQEFDNALANLNALKADSEFLHTQLEKTRLLAPFDGVIGIRNVSLGSYITPAFVVARIQQIHPIKIDFNLPEKYTGLLKVGDLVQFTTEGLNKPFTAKVLVKDPQVEVSSRSIRYRAVCPNPQGVLLPGTYARVAVELQSDTKNNNLFVPTEAIVPILDGKKIFVIKDGLAEERKVETGLRTEEFVQITSNNLQVGDSVVVTGNSQLKNGGKVKVSGGKKKKD